MMDNKTLGKITNLLNCGRGDSWNASYGIFRPMREWNGHEWIQYAVITFVFTDGLLHLSTGMGIMDAAKAGLTLIKESIMELRKRNSEEEESVEEIDVNLYTV